MRLITVFFLIFSTTSFVHAQMALNCDGMDFLNMEYSVELEVKEWSDSIEYQFLVVTVKKPIVVDTIRGLRRDQVVTIDQYYCDLSFFYIKRDDCRLYPIQFMNGVIMDSLGSMKYSTMQGLYPIDGVDVDSESLELVLYTQWGYMLQNQVNSSEHTVKIDNNPIEVVDIDVPLATKKWYKKWLKNQPTVHDLNSYYMYRGDCED
ncbi:MAG: hypothetical protein HRT58_16555 [Crocinitomicaceae bacterium]|nr:hypothetical protein [Flavobacteriales bacterium]NQZ37278.1 hypothetical protein [Crocinitomicaceae bacterium]